MNLLRSAPDYVPPPARKTAAVRASAAAGAVKALIQRRLSQFMEISPDDLRLLDVIVNLRKPCPAGSVLLGEAAASNHPRFLLSGWACRQLILPDGRRQIFGFLIPGDILAPDYENLLLGSIVTLTPASTAELPTLGEPGEEKSSMLFAVASSASTQERERLLHQQILRLGGMNALQRTAHLLMELCERLANVRLFDGQNLPFPLTQETLGDALGMSAVHVNRTLKQLRQDGAIQYASRSMLQVNIEKLSAIAQGPQRRD